MVHLVGIRPSWWDDRAGDHRLWLWGWTWLLSSTATHLNKDNDHSCSDKKLRKCLHYWNSPVCHESTALSSVFHQGGRQRDSLSYVALTTDGKNVTHGNPSMCRFGRFPYLWNRSDAIFRQRLPVVLRIHNLLACCRDVY